MQCLRQAVKEAVTYSRSLASLANDPTLPPGLGPVSVLGGPLQTEGRDLRELFRCLRRPSSLLLKLIQCLSQTEITANGKHALHRHSPPVVTFSLPQSVQGLCLFISSLSCISKGA